MENLQATKQKLQELSEVLEGKNKIEILLNTTEEEFIELFAYYNNELNILHPFREGNGRSKRIFLTEVARRAGFELDLDKLDPKELREADIAAFGNYVTGIAPSMYKLKVLFAENIKTLPTYTEPLKCKTVEQKINRILWFYDRDRHNYWQRCCTDYHQGELKVKELLKTKEGREELINHLECAMGGVKTNGTVERCKKLIEYIKSLNKENNNNLSKDNKDLSK